MKLDNWALRWRATAPGLGFLGLLGPLGRAMRAVLAAAALAGTAQTGFAAEPLPPWLREAIAREAALLPAVQVRADDGWFQASVPGAQQAEAVREGGSYSISVGLEGGVSMGCEVMPGPRDLAALLQETAEISFREIAKRNGSVEARIVEASDAGAMGAHPFLVLRWFFRALDSKGERRVGALQQFAADLGTATVYCAHDELGYHRSFEAVTRAVTGGLRVLGETAPEPYFREINVVTINGTKVGVANTTLTRDADGDTRMMTKSSMLVQRAAGELFAQDTVDIEWVRPDGSLINASQFKATEGKLVEDMALKADEDGRWVASGSIAGKEVRQVLDGVPHSFLSQVRARQGLLAQAQPQGSSVEGRVWSSLDLTQLLPSRATVLGPSGEAAFAVREEIGGMAMEVVLDRKTGTMRNGKIPMGPLTLQFERILQQGAP